MSPARPRAPLAYLAALALLTTVGPLLAASAGRPIRDGPPFVRLEGVAPGEFAFEVSEPSEARVWLPGDAAANGILNGHLPVFFESVLIDGAPWTVSSPLLVSRGRGRLRVDARVTRGLLLPGRASWPGADGIHHAYLGSTVEVDGAGPPALVRIAAPREGARLLLRDGERMVEVSYAGKRWHLPFAAPPPAHRELSLALQLEADGAAFYVDGRFRGRLPGRYRLEADRVRSDGLIPLTPTDVRLDAIGPVGEWAPRPPTLGWAATRLVLGDWSRRAYVYRYFLRDDFDVEAELVVGGGLVLAHAGSSQFLLIECIAEDAVLVRSVHRGRADPDRRISVPSCARIQVAKRPGRVLIHGVDAAVGTDLGRVGCLVRDLRNPHCSLRLQARGAG